MHSVCCLLLTHVRLCFRSSAPGWCSTPIGEAHIVVWSVLWRGVRHGWSRCLRWGLVVCSLVRRLPLTRTTRLPWRKASTGMPASRGSVLRRGSRTLGGAHGWKCSSCTSRRGGFAGESWSTFAWKHAGVTSESRVYLHKDLYKRFPLPPRLLPKLPKSANGSWVLGLAWWVGVLCTELVGLVLADLLPIPNPSPDEMNHHQQFNCLDRVQAILMTIALRITKVKIKLGWFKKHYTRCITFRKTSTVLNHELNIPVQMVKEWVIYFVFIAIAKEPPDGAISYRVFKKHLPAAACLFHSHVPVELCCWMLTVGVVGGTGELRPVKKTFWYLSVLITSFNT